MKSLTLKRVACNADGTFGVLIEDTVPFALTLEREWLDNRQNISCIPAGVYLCKRVTSAKFGETFEIMDVTGRTNILFHKGNVADDTEGCILVAEQFEYLGKKVAVLASAHGFKELMRRLEGDSEFTLTIVWV